MAAIFLGISIGILFIFLLIYIIINGDALKELNNKINNINAGTDQNLENEINNIKEKLEQDEKNIQSNKDSLTTTKKSLDDYDKRIKENKDNINVTTTSLSDLKKNYDKLSSSVLDNTNEIKLNEFGIFTLTVINDYSAIQKNKIKTSGIEKEIKDFYNKGKYFNSSNIVVVNNIKIATSDNDIKDTEYIYSLSEKDGFIYKTYVSFSSLDNLKLDTNKLLTFTTKGGTLYIKNYVLKLPDIEGNEFIFMIITHNINLYPNNDILIQSDLIKDINTKMEQFLTSFKDPLIIIISTLEQEYTEKFFSAFTFTKAKDYKKIQGDLDIIGSNTDYKLYNSLASTKFNNLYDSYKKGISIYKLKQPECRSIFLN